MEITNQVASVGAVLFDTNGTLVSCDEFLHAGRTDELRAVAKELGLSMEPESVERSIRMAAWAWKDAKERIEEKTGRGVTAIQVAKELGLSGSWWVRTASRCYKPEKWILPDSEMALLVGRIVDSCEVGIVSSHTYHVTRRMLSLLGFNHFLGRIHVFGPELMEASKVDPDHWKDVATALRLAPEQCVSVTDNLEAGQAAAKAGMTVVEVDGPAGTKKTCERLLALQADMMAADSA